MLSPRQYRIALTLPALVFLTGGLLFVIPIMAFNRAPNMISIVISLGGWFAAACASFLAKCPQCSKSHYERELPWRNRPLFFPKVWGAPWPERFCSRCGLEVGRSKPTEA